MFEFWLGIINPGFNWRYTCVSMGWMRRAATIDEPLIALYQTDPTNYQMVKDYIREQVNVKVPVLVPHQMDFTITKRDGYCIEYIQLDRRATTSYLEVAFDKPNMSQIGRRDLLWTRATSKLICEDGTGRLNYNVTKDTPEDARLLVDTILEHFPDICRWPAPVQRKTAVAMALHPRLGAGSHMCIDAELVAKICELAVN